MIKKITCLVLAILFITLTPMSSFLQIENNAYAISSTLTFEDALHSEMFKQTVIAALIGYGLTWNDPDAVNMTFEKILNDFETKGPDFKPPNKPDGPDLKQLVHDLLASASIAFTADGVYKNILAIDDMMADYLKNFIDVNYDEGINYSENENEETLIYSLGEYNLSFNLLPITDGKYAYIECFNGIETKTTTFLNWGGSGQLTNIVIKNIIVVSKYAFEINLKFNFDMYINGNFDRNMTSNNMMTLTFPTNISQENFVVKPFVPEEETYGTPGYVDVPDRDFVNNQSQTRTVVIPIEVDPLTGEPQKDENEIPIPGISTADWVGVTPEEIPNLDPHGMPYTAPEITPENPLPVNPELPENPTLEQIQDFTIIEYLKNLFQTNKNAAEMQDPTVMGIPSADGTGNGGTGTPTSFDWGDFSKFFDIFFIFIYFIVILILILLKFLKVVFSSLPNIPPNTDLFTNYPTILDGVNYIKNLKVGGMSVTVQQAFEYVFLIFFFIFVLKQLRKLYGAYVYEENERSRAESGISGSNIERRYQRTNYNSVINKARKSNYSGYSKGNTFDDAINNPDDYENIKFTDFSGD